MKNVLEADSIAVTVKFKLVHIAIQQLILVFFSNLSLPERKVCTEKYSIRRICDFLYVHGVLQRYITLLDAMLDV